MSGEFGYSAKVEVDAATRAAYVTFAVRTARAAGRATLPYFRANLQVDNKLNDGRFDPVTEADRSAERVIRDALSHEYPEHGIYGEEFGFQPGNGLTWVIDPIDGTRAFMSGMLHWGVLLGLFDGERPIVGAMYQPYTDELFVGDGEQAFFERGDLRRSLNASSEEAAGEAILATSGLDWFTGEDRVKLDRLRSAVKLFRIGGDCYIFALAAMGHVQLATDGNLNAYDILPLIPIIEGAGGVVSTYDGGDASLGGTVLAAGNAELHARALQILNGG